MRKLMCLIGLAALFASQPARGQNDDPLPTLVQLLGQSEDPQFQLDLLKGISAGLQGRRNVPMPQGWEDVAAKLKTSPNPEIRDLAVSLSTTFGSSSALADLRRQLSNNGAPLESRRRALTSLLEAKDSELPGVLQGLLNTAGLRGDALKGLAAYSDPNTPAAILAVYPQLSVSEKRDAVNTLAARKPFARALLDGVKDGAIPVRDLTADVVRQLKLHQDPAVDARVAELWGTTRETSADKQAQIQRLKQAVQTRSAGDPRRGRAVFARTCQQCHILFEAGGSVGPNITGSNRGDLDYILHNIVDPNAEIPNDYRTTVVDTTDDRVLTGIVSREDGNALTMITANDTVTVPLTEVQSRQQSELSMMPEGLADILTEAELIDLLAYLKSPQQVPMQAAEDNVGSFFNGLNLAGWDGDPSFWRVERGEIVGRSEGMNRNEWLAGPLWLGDFRLVCQVKLTPNTENSGIQFRSERMPEGEVKGYQADMGIGWWGKLYEEHGRGLLWDRSGDAYVRIDDWNTYEILAVGHHLRTAINGKLCVDLTDPQGALAGVIAFQLHSGGALEVRIKDIALELNPTNDLKSISKMP